MAAASALRLRALADRWSAAKAAERANAQSYLIELCEALGVERPRPAGSGYEFELPVRIVARDGSETTNFVDCYKAEHFALEAKDHEAGKAESMLLRRAYGQLRSYLGHLPHGRPPYLLVLDVGKTLLVWDAWRGEYGGFDAARRIDLRLLHDRPEDIALLRDIWEHPAARDPRSRSVAVTREIAAKLADLAATLERAGHGHEPVAQFLMRCVFTMFAEDVGLLPDAPFTRILDEVALAEPEEFVPLAEELWRAMDTGKRFMLRRLLKFSGHFFRDAKALPLTREALALLLEASRADWRDVEPTIFGTLLVRALDPVERHRLGAEYTPRAYVERLIRPTVEEPLRERWTAVQAEALQLEASGKPKDVARAAELRRGFHEWLRGLRFLDPACGSGNFLYATMHTVKRIEVEVMRALEQTTGSAELRLEEVGPWQFYGIEVKPWAREIAELVLWIGFHQFWAAHHAVQPPEPVLRDTGTLECRDAVLAWDAVRPDPARDRPDPTPRLPHPVTRELVPDPAARLRYEEYVGARPAPWPQADFIIGNPPYVGEKRQREVFGDGYVDALRGAYPEVPDSADFVTYWWYRAAEAVASGRAIRAGLITTSTLAQAKNRVVIRQAAERGAHVVWAAPDHPWVEGADGAAVRVAMTVLARDPGRAVRVDVDEDAAIVREVVVPRLNDDLSAHADVPTAAAQPLRANAGLAWQGYKLVGDGFVLPPEEAARLLAADPRHAEIIKPFRNGRDLATRPRGVSVIDFGLRSEDEARAYPALFDIVRTRVKPERDANPDRGRRTYWWRFGRTNENLRQSVAGLSRYIATLEVSRRRFFVFLDGAVAPDGALVTIGSDDAAVLGVLSSDIHVAWALAAGGRLGVGNDPRYNKTLCFDSFPFPDLAAPDVVARIREAAERLDAHRTWALGRAPSVTMTAMYQVLDKLRAGEALTPKERSLHDVAACGVLRDLHDTLDRLVAQAYGWAWPEAPAVVLERLVALHETRRAEEGRGRVRWLRPAYQPARYGAAASPAGEALALNPAEPEAVVADAPAWPATVRAQIAAVKQVLATEPLTSAALAKRFQGARRATVEQQLEILAVMGELAVGADGRYRLVESASVVMA